MIFEQQPQGLAFCNSPVIFEVSDPLNGNADFVYILKLYVWTGASGASGSVDFTLQKQPNQQGKAVFDVAKLIRPFIEVQNPSQLNDGITNAVNDCVYFMATAEATYSGGSVSPVDSNEVLATRGYVKYGTLNGDNRTHTGLTGPTEMGTYAYSIGAVISGAYCVDQVILDQAAYTYDVGGYLSTYTKRVNIAFNGKFTLGIFTDNIDELRLADDQGRTASVTITGGTDSTDKLKFVSVSPVSVRELGLAPDTSYSVSGYKDGQQVPETLRFNIVCEELYTPQQLIYLNGLGVWDYMTFFKRTDEDFNATKKEYSTHALLYDSPAGYDLEKGNNRVFDSNGKTRFVLNTGWVDESEAERMRQLLISERVVLNTGRAFMAVKVITSALRVQKHINDGLINYVVEVETAFNHK